MCNPLEYMLLRGWWQGRSEGSSGTHFRAPLQPELSFGAHLKPGWRENQGLDPHSAGDGAGTVMMGHCTIIMLMPWHCYDGALYHNHAHAFSLLVGMPVNFFFVSRARSTGHVYVQGQVMHSEPTSCASCSVKQTNAQLSLGAPVEPVLRLLSP
jgi:hypothetical protein